MANIEKLDGNIVQKHGSSKQVRFKQLGLGVETGVHGVHDEKHVWFEVELQGAQGDREAEVFQSGLSKVVLYKNMGFNESGEYKKTFIGSGVGTGLVQVLQGVEFKVEPQEDHTFRCNPLWDVDHVAGSQKYKLKI
ncbi:hypothetical protein Tco_1029106 [Tanacetum coccineum]|uniref:Uncharacterized protein n=1 Tax=Tanacetum coccineum TaxID=301880 RepID=A0ABQ5G2T9_9ASTR